MKAKFLNEQQYDINTDYLNYNKETRTLSTYISDLPPNFQIKDSLIVINPKTKNSKVFTFVNKDTDASGEDTYSWNYKSGNINLLIIND